MAYKKQTIENMFNKHGGFVEVYKAKDVGGHKTFYSFINPKEKNVRYSMTKRTAFALKKSKIPFKDKPKYPKY